MATVRSVIGSFKGSMGGVTFAKWKDKDVAKQKVPANNTSNTGPQALQRRKFAALAQAAAILAPLFRVGYRMAATRTTEQNVFMSRNKDAVTDNGTSATVDYSLLEVSSGNVLGVANLAVALNGATGAVTVTWDNNSNGSDGLPSDIIYVGGLMLEDRIPLVFGNHAIRTAGTITQTFPQLVGGPIGTPEVYALFKRAASTATSPSSTAIG